MLSLFLLFTLFIIIQRLIEFFIAKRNEIWMIERGGIEYDSKQYKRFVYLYIAFLLSLCIELLYNRFQLPTLNIILLSLFVIIQLVRVWCIYSLGRFWHTKTIIFPKVIFLKKGPYKYLKHPNDLIAGFEIILIPLIFGTYITGIVFPICYIILILIRMAREEDILLKNYKLKR